MDDWDTKPALRREDGGYVLPDQRLQAIEREQADAKERDEKYKQRQLRLNVWLVVLTAVTATVALAGIAIGVWTAVIAERSAKAAEDAATAANGQVTVAKDGITAQKEIAQKQLEASNKASARDIATQTRLGIAAVEQARDALVRQLRPWVMVRSTKLPKPLEVGVPPVFLLTVTNSGQGPALAVKAIESDHGYEPPCQANHRHLDPGASSKDSQMSLAPGGEFTMTHLGPAPTKAQLAQIKSPSNPRQMYLWGSLQYRDTLTSEVHVTRYCVVYDHEMTLIPDDKPPVGICECHDEAS